MIWRYLDTSYHIHYHKITLTIRSHYGQSYNDCITGQAATALEQGLSVHQSVMQIAIYTQLMLQIHWNN